MSSSAPLPVGVSVALVTPVRKSLVPPGITVNGTSHNTDAISDPSGKEAMDTTAPSVISAATSSEDLGPEDFKDAIDGDVPTFFSTMPSK